ncbi:MAG TPA: PDZ domain-containing protein [Candidatus Avalokitesvara rifleensis]|uniref:PDZ domain-containing protein n=1 Tax=Candidatus Avalokitesvara rifleensis TaxID=3367620 RepID=UPI00271437A3|nr:PDZ domain-containing protein [Candidatus Brocadiales bacterium]
MLSIFFVLMVLQTPSAIAEQKTSLFTGIVIKGARGAEGAEVVEVKPGSFSDSAGLKSGDIIVQVDGTKINSLGSFAEHSKKVERKDDIAVVVLRGGNNVNIEILRDPSQAGSNKGPAVGAVEPAAAAAGGAVGFVEEKTHEAVEGAKDVADEASEQAKETAHEAVKETKEAASDVAGFAEKETHKAVEFAENVTLDILYADEGISKEEQQSEGKKTEGGKTE